MAKLAIGSTFFHEVFAWVQKGKKCGAIRVRLGAMLYVGWIDVTW
jgi:hypothetical protein